MFFFGQEIRGDLMVGGHKISRDSLVTENPENNAVGSQTRHHGCGYRHQI